MRLGLLVTSLSGLSLAADLSGAWDVELKDPKAPNSCAKYAADLQKGYNEASDIVNAAWNGLESVKRARPSPSRANLPGVVDWDRISRALSVFFGWNPDKSGDGNSKNMQAVEGVYQSMKTTFGGTNKLPTGYSKLKPAIACGDSGWVYLKPTDIDPNDPQGRQLGTSQKAFATTGAWHYKQRLVWLADYSTLTNAGICQVNRRSLTLKGSDLITLCPPLLVPNPPGQFLGDAKATIKVDKDSLDNLASISRSIVHEFARYYGGNALTEQEAVDNTGPLLYIDENNQPTTTSVGPTGAKRTYLEADNFKNLQNLARPHTGTNNGNSGPQKCINNADSYAYFAMAAYLDQFDWSQSGTASSLPTHNCKGCIDAIDGKVTTLQDLSTEYLEGHIQIPDQQMQDTCIFYTSVPNPDLTPNLSPEDIQEYNDRWALGGADRHSGLSKMATDWACANDKITIWNLYTGGNDVTNAPDNIEMHNFWEVYTGGSWLNFLLKEGNHFKYFENMSRAMARHCGGTIYVMSMRPKQMAKYKYIWGNVEYEELLQRQQDKNKPANAPVNLISIDAADPSKQYNLKWDTQEVIGTVSQRDPNFLHLDRRAACDSSNVNYEPPDADWFGTGDPSSNN